jgi:PadR family transcriptional regulator AphA
MITGRTIFYMWNINRLTAAAGLYEGGNMISLQYAILGLLSYRQMTGYDLKKMFDDSINNFWAASLSQIYRELGTLENKGYLTSEIEKQNDRPDKRIYGITDGGRDAVREWISNFPEKLSKEKRDEFTLRIFFGSNLTKEELIFQFRRFKEEKQQQLEEIEYFYQISDRYVMDMELFNGEEIYWKLILRRAYLTVEMSIRWAGECIEDLEKMNGEGIEELEKNEKEKGK